MSAALACAVLPTTRAAATEGEIAELMEVFNWFQSEFSKVNGLSFDEMFSKLPDDAPKVDAVQFKTWWLQVSAKLPKGYLPLLQATISKHVGADKLFKHWDADSSGFIETSELTKVFGWFQEEFGAEDGLMFGSVHSSMAVEFLRGLQEVKFDGHLYFDTFPRNEDPVRECAYNIRRVKALWAKAARLTREGVAEHLKKHDALGALELMESLETEVTDGVAGTGVGGSPAAC